MHGQIVILNGAPRSGKSSIAKAIQAVSDVPWMVYGVDAIMAETPAAMHPGIGLRPGGERPDLEPFVVSLYWHLYDTLVKFSHEGKNVVADTGHHDEYSRPQGILPSCARIVEGLPAYLIGVKCPLEVVMERRAVSGWTAPREYAKRWQEAVHKPGIYDFEVDTSQATPESCARSILQRVADEKRPAAFARLAKMSA